MKLHHLDPKKLKTLCGISGRMLWRSARQFQPPGKVPRTGLMKDDQYLLFIARSHEKATCTACSAAFQNGVPSR